MSTYKMLILSFFLVSLGSVRTTQKRKKIQVSNRILLNTHINEVWTAVSNLENFDELVPEIIASTESIGNGEGAVVRLTLQSTGLQVVEKVTKVDNKKHIFIYEMIETPMPIHDYKATVKIDLIDAKRYELSFHAVFKTEPENSQTMESTIQNFQKSFLSNIKKNTMKNKIWFITGISSGLGKALAESVMQKGDFVVGTFRQQAQAEAFNKRYHGEAFAVKLDITDTAEVAKVIGTIISKWGRIDVLVNNAGTGFVGAIEETSLEEVRQVFEANFFGALHLSQVVLPYMRKEKTGHIVQISSHGGIKAFAGFGIYNASKFALEGFSEAMAQEVAPLGITVSLVEPGPFRTKFAGKGLGLAKKKMEVYAETAGAFRSKLQSVDGKQEGDPEKASEAIIAHVNSKNPTLRLPLGKVALMTIGMKLDSVKSDLETHRRLAENAVY